MSDATVTRSSGSSGALWGMFVLALLVLAGVSVLQMNKAGQQLQALTIRMDQIYGATTPDAKTAEVLAKVRRHIVLPDDVQPLVATIVDVQKLQEQNPFYANARNGDYLLVTSQKAILYRLAEDRIIDITPVSFQPAPSSSAPAARRR